MEKNKLTKKIIKYSIQNKLKHIPSALSQAHYIYELFKSAIDTDWNIIIGKPFGSQGYYIPWSELYNLNIKTLSPILNHNEISFIDYSEPMIGNALGVASGISYNGRKTWCNISDGALQMGPTLEAIQFIGHNKLDIFLTIDYNDQQLTGSMSSVLGTSSQMIYDYFIGCGWNTYIVHSQDFDGKVVQKLLKRLQGPIVIIIKTVKGDGVIEMEDDPTLWHYKQLEDINEITFR